MQVELGKPAVPCRGVREWPVLGLGRVVIRHAEAEPSAYVVFAKGAATQPGTLAGRCFAAFANDDVAGLLAAVAWIDAHADRLV